MLLATLVAAFAAGCGGSTPPAEAPSATDAPRAGSPGEETPTPSPKEHPAEADEAAAPAAADELGTILQRVIEDEELDKYLHLTEPGRFPLKISGADLPSGLSLVKGNQPVSVVDAPKTKKDAVLVITSVELSRSQATIAFRYDVEGIRGTARLKKADRGWELTSSRIVEH